MISVSRAEFKALILLFNVDMHDALILLQHVLSQSYSSLFLAKEFRLSEKQFEEFKSKLKLRSEHVPIAKIIGYKAFYNHNFITNRNTLDPRPETELIIDLVQKYFCNNKSYLSVLDLGCGTGCIGLSILDLYPKAKLLLADISANALDVAKRNAVQLNLAQRCNYVLTNWFSCINQKFDIIVCNPPYVANNYNLGEDTLYDPKIALFGGKNGLDCYKNIIPKVHKYLNAHGMFFVEFGFNQCRIVCNMVNNLQIIEIAKDLNNINRVAVFSPVLSNSRSVHLSRNLLL